MNNKTEYETAGALIIGNAGFLADAYQGGYLDLDSHAIRNAFIGITTQLKERERIYKEMLREMTKEIKA